MSAVALRTCKVSVADLEGIEHSVEVTAGTLYEAVAAALAAFREDEGLARSAMDDGCCHRSTACGAAPSTSQRLPRLAAKEDRLAR